MTYPLISAVLIYITSHLSAAATTMYFLPAGLAEFDNFFRKKILTNVECIKIHKRAVCFIDIYSKTLYRV